MGNGTWPLELQVELPQVLWGILTLKQIRRTTKDLQAQFDAVRQGNLNVQATVYSEDELGLLSHWL